MGGEISIDDLNKLPPHVFDRSPKERATDLSAFAPLLEEEDRETASEAVKALAQIALETKNRVLAETCRNVIGLILAEYSAAACNEGSGSDG